MRHTTPVALILLAALSLGVPPACGQSAPPAPAPTADDAPPPKARNAPKQVGTVRILEPGQKASDPIKPSPTEPARADLPAASDAPPPLAGPRVSPNQPGTQPGDTPGQPGAMQADPMQRMVDAARPQGASAARALGHRAAAVRLSQQIIPVVVIVDDGASFADAIAGWDRETRYPVLWDDGSTDAAEHIARFVRAFAPGRVVRWDTKKAWPEDRGSRQDQIDAARAAALGLEPKRGQSTDSALLEWLATINYDAAGVIVTDATDPAWPAALALAAGRLQPVVFTNSVYGYPSGGMSTARAEVIDNLVRKGLDDLSLEYDGLGAGIDAVTLVGGFPVRVKVGDDDFRSLTDRIGRTSSELGDGGSLTQDSPRWAWTGQIFGTEPYAAYAAMCSLFLQTDTLWAFNTYAESFAPSYALAEPAKLLEENMGFTSTVFNGPPSLGLDSWRSAVSRGGIDAGLVLVNSHGNAPEFNFSDKTRAYSGDVPLLATPSIVQFIHSFSMQRPGNLNSIGGRWLNHGAYAYIGSMHEPYLDAFVPPISLAARLSEGWALGAAARTDHRGWWRITTHGDPLITLGPAGTRTEIPLPLTGTDDLAETMRAELAAKDYAGAIRSLVLQGRDHDAARLVASLVADQPERVSRTVAEAGVGPMFRDRNFAGVLELWSYVGPQAISTPALSDALWGAARMQRAVGDRSAGEPAAALSRLKQNLRPEQQGEDATEIAEWIAQDDGRRAAVAYLKQVQTRLKSDTRARRVLSLALKSHGG